MTQVAAYQPACSGQLMIQLGEYNQQGFGQQMNQQMYGQQGYGQPG